jgi:transposase
MGRRYALRNDQWERIKDLLPGREGHVGVTARDNRLFVEAVLYRYRSGIPWRDLPERFGDFRVVHLRPSRRGKSGSGSGSSRPCRKHSDYLGLHGDFPY